jgi:hypothetical protein
MLKLTDVSEVHIDSITAMMEAVRTSETSVNFNNVTIRRCIPEDSKPHARRREDLKSHMMLPF